MSHAHAAGAFQRARKHENFGIADEPQIDALLDELIHALKEQLTRFRNAERKASASWTKSFAANARILLAMERALERVLEVEKQRAAMRQMRAEQNPDGARAKLEEKIERLARFYAEEERIRRDKEWRKTQEDIETLGLLGTA